MCVVKLLYMRRKILIFSLLPTILTGCTANIPEDAAPEPANNEELLDLILDVAEETAEEQPVEPIQPSFMPTPTPAPAPVVSPPAPAPTPTFSSLPAPAPPPEPQPERLPPPAPPPAPAPPSSPFSCFPEKTCGQMISCEEAYYHLTVCGHSKRDGDNDGVPCESICPGG